MSEPISLSVTIPVYNSAKIFPELHSRLVENLSQIVDSFEIIAVVDGCSDNSADVIAQISQKDSRVKLIEFSRNFGHQTAITAGLQFSSGEMMIVMDDDLEDPPEVLPEMIAKAQEGYDIVYGTHRKRKTSLIRQKMSDLYYVVFSKLSNFDIPKNVGDFCLMKRHVVDVLNSMPENNRYIRGLRAWVGFRQISIDFDRAKRFEGESGFNMIKYFLFALNGILSFSDKPLKYIAILGFMISSLSFIAIILLTVLRLLEMLPFFTGWASIIVTILFIGGVQLVSLGVIGEYIGRIHDEVKRRPLFIIKRSIGIEKEN